jgi:hypothetical protein
MILHQNAYDTTPAREIRDLIARLGYRRFSLALLAALISRPGPVRHPDVGGLSDYLRRDIGLPPDGPGLRGVRW